MNSQNPAIQPPFLGRLQGAFCAGKEKEMFKTIIKITDKQRGEIHEYSYTDRFLAFALVDALNCYAEMDGFNGVDNLVIEAKEVPSE